MKYTIEDLRNGKCAVINDGTIEELRKVMELAFPNDYDSVVGSCTYYFKSNIHLYKWDVDNSTSLQTQSVKDFLNQDTKFETKKMKKLSKKEVKLLDKFASIALQSLISKLPLTTTHQNIVGDNINKVSNDEISAIKQSMAESSYKYAEYMIKERRKLLTEE